MLEKVGPLSKEEQIKILENQLVGIKEDMPGARLEDMQDELLQEREEIEEMLAELRTG